MRAKSKYLFEKKMIFHVISITFDCTMSLLCDLFRKKYFFL